MTAKTIMVKIKGDTKGLINATKQAKQQVSSTVKTIGMIGTAFTSAAAVVAGVRFAVDLTQVAAAHEKLQTTLINIEGSSERARQSLSWVQNFAAQTPYQIEQVTQSFISLKAYGLDPMDGTMRALGDTASAMGKPLQQAVEAMADAVTGENERLKEFGIRAAKMGDEIKYMWRNASGEARQIVVANNSSIIQSTLTSIFNSKYAGAMKMQADTWNGMLSNIQDNWTIAKQNIMNAGLFDYMKSIVKVVGEYLSKAFGKAGEGAGAFAKYAIEGIKSTIIGLGGFYDALETIGDLFEVVKNGIIIGWYGIRYTALTVANMIDRAYTDMANAIIGKINWLIAAANAVASAVGLPTLGSIAEVNYSSTLQQDYLHVTQELDKYKQKFADAYVDLNKTGEGAKFGDEFIAQVDKAYEKIKNAPEINIEKTDFGELDEGITKAQEDKREELEKYTPAITDEDIANAQKDLDDFLKAQGNVIEKINNKTIQNSENFKQANEQIDETWGKMDPHPRIYTEEISKPISENITKPFIDVSKNIQNRTIPTIDRVKTQTDKLNKSTDSLSRGMKQATKVMGGFIFKFKDSFIDTLKSTQGALGNVFKTDGSAGMISYEEAYEKALSAQQNLINNPLDTKIGEEYEKAYQIFVSASDEFLSNKENFASQADWAYASASIGTQTSRLQSTAVKAYDVLDNMKDLLGAINKAMADGVLTNEEKATIAGVADKVNVSNTKLLGEKGLVKTINSQTYYDRYGAKQQGLIDTIGAIGQSKNQISTNLNTVRSSVEGVNNSINNQEYYNNSSLAKDSSLIGSNSVSTYINDLNGNGSGITLDRVTGSVRTLSVNTGLDYSQIAEIKNNTNNINNATGRVQSATNAAKDSIDKIKGINDNIKSNTFNTNNNVRRLVIKRTTTTERVTNWLAGTNVPTGTESTTLYEYYAKGGFTRGIGKRDKTGFKVAGYVHEDEWVAPKWMVEKNKPLFNSLESLRLSGYAKGGYTSKSGSLALKDENTDQKVLNELLKLNRLLREVTDNGNAMRVDK